MFTLYAPSRVEFQVTSNLMYQQTINFSSLSTSCSIRNRQVDIFHCYPPRYWHPSNPYASLHLNEDNRALIKKIIFFFYIFKIPFNICLLKFYISVSLNWPYFCSRREMDPPLTYSRNMFILLSIYCIP